jgi:murein DD-endopeptidase MepM/ murein hydrolase activator NlpD
MIFSKNVDKVIMIDPIENQHVARRRKPSPVHNSRENSRVFYNTAFVRQIRQKPSHSRNRESAVERGRAGFSFHIPSLGVIALIAGVLLVSLIVLNWEDGTFTVTGAGTVQPGAGSSPLRLKGSQDNPFITVKKSADQDESANVPVQAEAQITAQPAAAMQITAQTPAASAAAEITESRDMPVDLIETFHWTSYRVQKGDSVSKIAAKFSLSIDAIIASNGLNDNAQRLLEGWTLKIPNMDGIPYTVKQGDSLLKIAKTMGVPLEVILDVNDIQSDAIQAGEILFIPGARMPPEDLKRALGKLFAYPVRGRLSDAFGWRNDPITGIWKHHGAIDLAAPTGTRVNAAIDGTIAYTGFNNTYGKFIIMKHTGGYQTVYAHLSAISVKQGEQVKQGNKIGEVGNTGYSTGPHLHFAVLKNNKAVNPLDLLNK